MADNKFIHDNGCKEAVCVDAGRVYDSCSDKDCIEDMRVYFTERDQMVVDHAASIRARRAEVITTYIDVEALPFNRGYYSCDLTFFFEVEVEVYAGHGMPCSTVCGVGMFQKKVILYGSEGNVRVFSSEFRDNSCDPQDMPGRNAPRCTVQECICNRYGGGFCDDEDNKIVLVTLGIFTIVQLVRNVQMLVPVYDYCMPCKECCPTTDNPCDLFKKMCFPVNEFFPPTEDGRGGCCEKK